MNIAEYCIQKRTITYVLALLLLAGGLLVYPHLGRFEDPGVAIKICPVATSYPGASPQEVEQEVTDVIESALQSLWQVKEVTSVSQAGLSVVKAEFKDHFRKEDLPQIFDEVRRKVADAQKELPPGASPSIVNDDFGDEYGILFALTGDGYTFREVEAYARFLRMELLQVPGVARIEFWGVRPEAIYVEIAQARLGQLGLSMDAVFAALQKRDLVVNPGTVQMGDRRIRVELTGTADSWEMLGGLLISGGGPGDVPLRDIATLSRGYQDPPRAVLRVNGRPAIGFGISTEEGGNVVAMGDAVRARLEELEPRRPMGMERHTLSFQGETVRAAVDGFVVSVFQALAIVVGVLMVFMGLRSGLIIGVVLLLIVAGTFLVMQVMGIDLQRISLGALIVALGMLVDNAIVITDGVLVGIGKGQDRIKAAASVAGQTLWPLLGATLVAIMAFAAIGFSPDSTGEYCKSLFQVIAISLLLSWLLAVTVTPLLCVDFLKAPKKASSSTGDEGKMTGLYRRFLRAAIRRRRQALALMGLLLVAGMYGFSRVPPAFFPQSARPQFVLDYWLPQGTDIERTLSDTRRLEEFVMGLDGVETVSTWVGRGALRFLLVYSPEDSNPAYAQLLITVKDSKEINALIPKIRAELDQHYLDAQTKIWKFVLGPGGGSAIEARFSGPDQNVLRRLGQEAREIMRRQGNAVNIKEDWRQPVPYLEAVLREEVAARLGLTRPEVAAAIQWAADGRTVGSYRDGDDLVPVVVRLPASERNQADQLAQVPVYGTQAGQSIPVGQLVSRWDTRIENPLILRRNRARTLTAQCDPASGPSSALLGQIRPDIEALARPEGYQVEWGGDDEDSQRANAGIASTMPLTFTIMVLLIVMLFNALRQPLIIFLTVPLALVGVAAGLLITQVAFDFMATLGFLSLTGMLIKNSVVLIDQMDIEMRGGKPPLQAVVDSTVDRTRPVLMASLTTVLGLFPLLSDVFFQGLSVVIMFGLSFAAVLTLVAVPVLYASFFRVKSDEN